MKLKWFLGGLYVSRYRGPSCKLCRREGEQLFLKGARCYTDKCAINRRGEQPPGIHGKRRSKFSEYGIRLREKQKVKRIYGLTEKQFRKYFESAARTKGVTGALLISSLERRLDNTVFKLGFASSRTEARQMVWQGHIKVNGRRVDIPSYHVKEGDVIEIQEKSREIPGIKLSFELLERRGLPGWLEIDTDGYKGVVNKLPERDDVTVPIQEQLIVEFYSRV